MIVFGWVYFVIYQLLSALVTLVGLVVLFPLAVSQSWITRPSTSKYWPGKQVTAWKGGILTAAWNNEEDGVTGADWFKTANRELPAWKIAYLWSAWRNSANGLRQLPGAMFALEAAKCRVVQYSWGTVATQGWRSGIRTKNYHIGWLIQSPYKDGYLCWPVIAKL